ncbi:MAG: polysaccharide deacetylase family protein [Pleurocapsa sp. SU_196_0]|nr:polysaccharide deacetylase family protein [Pleurocapsa sp. SU_196_0]
MMSRLRVTRPVPNFEIEPGRSPNGIPSCKGFAASTSGFVGLTFDDGPHPVNTVPLLEYLLENDIWASFFLQGDQAKQHPDIVRALFKAGMVIGNHSWDHPDFQQLTAPEIVDQVTRAHDTLSGIIGEPVRVFRAPFNAIYDCTGSPSPLFDTLQKLGYSHYCSYDPGISDWQGETVDELIDQFKALLPAQHGFVNFDHKWILLHDVQGNPERMRELLDWINQQVSQLSLRFAGVISSV